MNNWKQPKKIKLCNSSNRKEKEQRNEHHSNKTYEGVYVENCKMLMQEIKEGTTGPRIARLRTVQMRFLPTLAETVLQSCPDTVPQTEWVETAEMVSALDATSLRPRCQQGQPSAASGTCLASSGSRGCPLSWVLRGGGCSAFTPASVV